MDIYGDDERLLFVQLSIFLSSSGHIKLFGFPRFPTSRDARVPSYSIIIQP